MVRAISTNIHLKKWKIKASDQCSFCGEYVETYMHLFVKCEKVIPLWSKVKEILQDMGDELKMAPVNILFHDVSSNMSHISNNKLHVHLRKWQIAKPKGSSSNDEIEEFINQYIENM